jgi:hypothetical protein
MPNFERLLNQSLKNFSTYGSFYYTRRQLYHEFCRAARSPRGFDWQTAAAVFGLGLLPAFGLRKQNRLLSVGLIGANALLAGGLSWLRYTPHTLEPPFTFTEFDDWLDKQEDSLSGLIQNTQINSLPSFDYEPDLTLYGLPRMLVCQSDEIAAMLRANYFNMEASCAVLSLREAAPLGENYRKMLELTPNPKVFYLHDASIEGYSFVPILRERLEIPKKAAVNLLGLRPDHARRLHLFVQQNQVSSDFNLDAISFLSEDEKRWLQAGWIAEISAVHPVRLLRVLRRLVLQIPTPPSIWKMRLPPRSLGFMSSNYE